MAYILRLLQDKIEKIIKRGKSILLLGPRQTGKTTLIRKMNDTHPKIKKLVCQMMSRKTPEERLMMSSSMHMTSKLLVIDAIRRNNPNITPARLRQELFLKFYGEDVSYDQKQKILAYLAENTNSHNTL